MNKVDLNKKAAPIFERYGVKKLFATSDGQIFLLQSRAHLHAKNGHTVIPLTQQEASASDNKSDDIPQISVKNLVATLADKNLEQLKAILLEEVSGPNRKSAVDAIEKHLEKAAESEDKKPEGSNSEINIDEETDLVVLNNLLNAEKSGDNQPEMIDKLENRIAELEDLRKD